MWIDFDTIANTARIWVYTANRSLTDAEVLHINTALPVALGSWAAHGQPLLASARVIEHRFVIIAVDEDQTLPSGCSIDASTHFLKGLGQTLQVDFFDRSIAFQGVDGHIETVPALAAKQAVVAGKIKAETLIFNSLVKTKAEFMTNWTQSAVDSWLRKYVQPVQAASSRSAFTN